MYDPALGRTFQHNPHADNYDLISPYSWVGNNPLYFIDPSGKDIVFGGGQYGGDLYTGIDAKIFFRNLQRVYSLTAQKEVSGNYKVNILGKISRLGNNGGEKDVLFSPNMKRSIQVENGILSKIVVVYQM